MATVPPSIRAAFDQANTLWPSRVRASDGAVGDPAHASRASDHNPDSRGIVHAFDLTHDPGRGVDCNTLAERVLTDPRAKYVIWNRRINTRDGRGWRTYTGSNPHDKHMHVSIHSGSGPENDSSPWWDGGGITVAEADRIIATLGEYEKDTRAQVIAGVAENVKQAEWRTRRILADLIDAVPNLDRSKLSAETKRYLSEIG